MTTLGDLLGTSVLAGIHLVQTDESTLRDRVVALITSHPRAAIRIIRGTKSRTLAAFFDESAAALQFPYYFGENWSAFDDVVGELTAIPADAYLFVFSNAELLLSESTPNDFRILAETLFDLHAAYANAGRLSLHIAFHCATPASVAIVSDRLHAAKVGFDLLDAA